jgi:hypothetical protein
MVAIMINIYQIKKNGNYTWDISDRSKQLTNSLTHSMVQNMSRDSSVV